MARGWESKLVEDRAEEAKSRPRKPAEPEIDPAEAARRRERDGLLLHRTRVLHDIETARNPRYQEVLKAALAHLDEQLGKLEGTK